VIIIVIIIAIKVIISVLIIPLDEVRVAVGDASKNRKIGFRQNWPKKRKIVL
jgi:hypothetical protein